MENNKIVYNGDTLIDLTNDTATEGDVLSGKTFHKANGEQAIGVGAGPDTITNCSYLFAGRPSRIDEFINTKINAYKVDHLFYDSNATNQKIQQVFNTSRYNFLNTFGDLTEMFYNSQIQSFDFNKIGLNFTNWIFKGVFKKCSSLRSVTFTQNMPVNDLNEMFRECVWLQTMDLNNIVNTGNAYYKDLFRDCNNLITVTLPSTNEKLDIDNIFYGCNKLSTINNAENFFKNVSNCNHAFYRCMGLINIKLPYFKCVNNYGSAQGMFRSCENIKTIDILWDCSDYNFSYTNEMFGYCISLENLVIRWTGGVPRLTSSDAFYYVPSTCNIYVPDDLVDQYKVATNWVMRASQIKPLSEYVEE